MMTINAAKLRADRLEKMARAAIAQYNEEMAGGGEPLFPDWALEMIGLIADYDRMVSTMAKQRFHLVDAVDFETNTTRATVVQIQRAAS
jgi:hypothetical protein